MRIAGEPATSVAESALERYLQEDTARIGSVKIAASTRSFNNQA
jgi:hypothetical protein